MAEEIAQAQADPAALDDVGGRSGIEVEGEDGGAFGRSREGERGVELDRRQLRHPDQRRPAVADAEVDLARMRAGFDARGLHPFRPVLGAALLEEGRVEVIDPFGEAAQRDRATFEVGDDRRGDLGVVVDHLALGEAGLRVEDLVEVGELQLTAVDLDLTADGHGLFRGFGFAPRGGAFFRRCLGLFLRGGLSLCFSAWPSLGRHL